MHSDTDNIKLLNQNKHNPKAIYNKNNPTYISDLEDFLENFNKDLKEKILASNILEDQFRITMHKNETDYQKYIQELKSLFVKDRVHISKNISQQKSESESEAKPKIRIKKDSTPKIKYNCQHLFNDIKIIFDYLNDIAELTLEQNNKDYDKDVALLEIQYRINFLNDYLEILFLRYGKTHLINPLMHYCRKGELTLRDATNSYNSFLNVDYFVKNKEIKAICEIILNLEHINMLLDLVKRAYEINAKINAALKDSASINNPENLYKIRLHGNNILASKVKPGCFDSFDCKQEKIDNDFNKKRIQDVLLSSIRMKLMLQLLTINYSATLNLYSATLNLKYSLKNKDSKALCNLLDHDAKNCKQGKIDNDFSNQSQGHYSYNNNGYIHLNSYQQITSLKQEA